MNIIISARHCTPSRSVRRLADERIRRLARFEPGLSSAAVSFDLDHGRKRVDARLFVAGSGPVVAEAVGETFRVALGRLSDRLERQLRRGRERRTDHQAPKPSRVAAAMAERAATT